MTLPPVSRRGNPQTSKQAEAQIGDIRRSQIDKIVEALRKYENGLPYNEW